MDPVNDRFDFGAFDNGIGNSGFGQAHGPGIDLRPELPTTTADLRGVDLTHTLYTDEVSSLSGGAHVNGGGGGTASVTGTSGYADYTTKVAGSAYNITIHFDGTNWTSAEHQAFVDAANRISSLIVGDVPNVTVYGLKGGPVK